MRDHLFLRREEAQILDDWASLMVSNIKNVISDRYIQFQSNTQIIRMENLKIKIIPLFLKYKSQNPLSLVIKYKRVLITTNHELEKIQCRKRFMLVDNQAKFDSEEAKIQIQLSKEFQLMNTKVQIIFVQYEQLENKKWKHQIKLLGTCTIDLGNYETQSEFAISHESCERQIKVKLEKSDDKQSQMSFLLEFQGVKHQKHKEKQKNLENGILKTQSYHKETLIAKRKMHPEMPNAYEISRRNYKHTNVSRNEDNGEKSKSSKGSVGSYRKRFEYQEVRNNKKKNETMRIFPQKKHKDNDISPRPRLKTPEPIQSMQKYETQTVKQGTKYNHHQIARRKIEKESQIYVVSKSQISHYEFNESSEDPISKEESLNESSDMENIKENKYKIITQKLQAIDRKINSKKYQTPLQQIHSEEKPRQLNPHEIKKSGHMINSQVSHFSPEDNSHCEKKDKIQSRIIYQSENIGVPVEESGFCKVNKNSSYLSPSRVHTEKQNVKTKDKEEYEKKILNLELVIDEAEELQRKKFMEIQLQFKNRIKVIEGEKSALSLENQKLKKQNDSKQKLIDKLNRLYEESDDRCFEIQKTSEASMKEYEERIQILLKKNNDLSETIEKLGQREERQQTDDNSKYKADYLNEKAKTVNLQAQIRQKENDLKFMKLNYENIKEQKIELEEEIQILAKNDKKQLSRKGSISMLNMENPNISTSVKIQNKALKEQIISLEKQVHELNVMLENLINKKIAIDKSQYEKNEQEENWKNLNKKYQALQRKITAYENQVEQKKMKIADIINIIWKYNNPDLIEEVDRTIGIQ